MSQKLSKRLEESVRVAYFYGGDPRHSARLRTRPASIHIYTDTRDFLRKEMKMRDATDYGRKPSACSGVLAVLSLCICCRPTGALQHNVDAQPSRIELSDVQRSREIPVSASPSMIPDTEIWEEADGHRTVRNVTRATLTPVLPDPSRATGLAVIVAPGGGFMYLEIDKEGFEVARLLADHGITAFVLKYRTKPTSADFKAFRSDLMEMLGTAAMAKTFDLPTPLDTAEDAENAVRLVRTHATQWGVDSHRVGFLGFSAGAITTLTMALLDNKRARPDFVASIYGPMTGGDVPRDAPPAFFALALDDSFFGHRSIEIVDSWRKSGRPVEAHLYMIGGHGFANAHKSKSSELWLDEFCAWTADLTKVKNTNR